MNPAGDFTQKLRVIDGAGLAALVLLSAMMFFVGVRPMLQQQAAYRDRMNQLLSERQRASDLTGSLNEMRHQLMTTEQAIASYPLRLEPLSHLNQRLSQITELASASGLEVTQLEPREGVAGAHYITVPIRVVGQGSFQTSTRFLHRLYEQLPDTAVAAVDLSGRPGASAMPATFAFDLLWYAAPQP
jgi:Tfp pilus assembly protein PilO